MRGLRCASGSDLDQHARRVLDAFLDALQEGDGFAAIDDAVVIGQRDIHHRANDHLAIARHGTILNGVQAEDAGLRRVHDRSRQQRAIDAAIGDGDAGDHTGAVDDGRGRGAGTGTAANLVQNNGVDGGIVKDSTSKTLKSDGVVATGQGKRHRHKILPGAGTLAGGGDRVAHGPVLDDVLGYSIHQDLNWIGCTPIP